jgi:hypothetical protein
MGENTEKEPELTPEQAILVGLGKRLDALEKFLEPKQFGAFLTAELTPLVENISKRFEAIDARLKQAPAQGGGGFGSLFDGIGKAIGQAVENRISGAVNPTVGGPDAEIASMGKELTKIYFKGMLQRARKDFGVLESAADHVVLAHVEGTS